jgi:hypothetical protein
VIDLNKPEAGRGNLNIIDRGILQRNLSGGVRSIANPSNQLPMKQGDSRHQVGGGDLSSRKKKVLGRRARKAVFTRPTEQQGENTIFEPCRRLPQSFDNIEASVVCFISFKSLKQIGVVSVYGRARLIPPTPGPDDETDVQDECPEGELPELVLSSDPQQGEDWTLQGLSAVLSAIDKKVLLDKANIQAIPDVSPSVVASKPGSTEVSAGSNASGSFAGIPLNLGQSLMTEIETAALLAAPDGT